MIHLYIDFICRLPQAVPPVCLLRRRQQHHGEPRDGLQRPAPEPAHRTRQEAQVGLVIVGIL